MPPATADPSPQKFPKFILELILGIHVRRRLGAIVEAVCGGTPRAQDITDRFGVYRKLGWQIWNVVYADDALAAIKHLPNPRTLKVWHAAARKQGIREELLLRLDEAIVQFHKSAGAHAGDREMLEMLVESNNENLDEAATIRWRKQSFAGNSFTWGVRAKCMLAVAFIFPSATRDGYFDMVRIQGLIGLVRTRPNVRWPFAQLLIRDGEGKKHQFARVPLVESAAVRQTGVPLVEEFCSKPLPRVMRRPGNMGMVEDELLGGEVGESGASDIITAEVLREVAPAWPKNEGETATFGTGVRTPTELLISDQLVHRDLFPGVQRELCVFGELMTQLSRDERDRIPVPEKVQQLGNAADGIGTAEVARYHDLLDFVFAKTGLQAQNFEAFRVRMRYPPLPVSVLVRHPMPMKT
ncbi:hypothetical protein BH09PLA1_BH09PLA1_10760 [soil metagenome]